MINTEETNEIKLIKKKNRTQQHSILASEGEDNYVDNLTSTAADQERRPVFQRSFHKDQLKSQLENVTGYDKHYAQTNSRIKTAKIRKKRSKERY